MCGLLGGVMRQGAGTHCRCGELWAGSQNGDDGPWGSRGTLLPSTSPRKMMGLKNSYHLSLPAGWSYSGVTKSDPRPSMRARHLQLAITMRHLGSNVEREEGTSNTT